MIIYFTTLKQALQSHFHTITIEEFFYHFYFFKITFLLSLFKPLVNVPVQHAARAYGKSGYSFRRLVKDLIYDITAHTAFPLLMVRNIGIASFLVSFLLGIYYLVRYFLCGISVEGWTSLMLVMLAFFGLTLLSIGIIGIYLMNILNEAKKMPHYVIRQEETD